MRWELVAAFVLSLAAPAYAGKGVGEDAAYAREVGFEQRFFYVAGGSDGAGQVEYICQAAPGTTGSDDTAATVWQVKRFYYNSSSQLTRISYAGDNDAYDQICDNRASLNYD